MITRLMLVCAVSAMFSPPPVHTASATKMANTELYSPAFVHPVLSTFRNGVIRHCMHSERTNTCRIGLRIRMDDTDSGSLNDELWASLRKRIPVQEDKSSSFVLPTADNMDPKAVVTEVLRALEQVDQPYEGHGTEILLAYSSPTAKETFNDPKAAKSFLARSPVTDVLLELTDFRLYWTPKRWHELRAKGKTEDWLTDERWLNYSKSCIIKAMVRRESGAWQEVHFSLSRSDSRWLIDDVGRAPI